MSVIHMLEFDDGIGFPACFTANTTSAVLPGFVNIVAGGNWTIQNTLSSGTVSPIGVITESAASATESIEVRSTGYVWMTGVANTLISAGRAVFPAALGTIRVTGATDASGNAKLGNRGFGTVIVGCASGGDALVKLERMY